VLRVRAAYAAIQMDPELTVSRLAERLGGSTYRLQREFRLLLECSPMAGPTFEVHHFSGYPVTELRSMAAAVAEQHPTLVPIGAAL